MQLLALAPILGPLTTMRRCRKPDYSQLLDVNGRLNGRHDRQRRCNMFDLLRRSANQQLHHYSVFKNFALALSVLLLRRCCRVNCTREFHVGHNPHLA